jgi:hypothetical protein
VRVGASEVTDEAEIEIINAPRGRDDQAAMDLDEGGSIGDRTLDAAKKAATVPAALLGGLLRRR